VYDYSQLGSDNIPHNVHIHHWLQMQESARRPHLRPTFGVLSRSYRAFPPIAIWPSLDPCRL
jgi:hypothetical protein